MKKWIVLLVTLCLMTVFVGCGGSASDDPNLGTYIGTTAKANGIEISIASFFGEGFNIELRANGKCKITVDTESAVGKWTLDGEAFTVKGGGIECEGTLSDGVIILENVLDAGVDLTLVKEGNVEAAETEAVETEVPETETVPETDVVAEIEDAETEALLAEAEVMPEGVVQTEAESEVVPEGALKYVITGYMVNGETYGHELVEETGMEETYLQLNPDGSAVLCVSGQSFDVSWDKDGNLSMYGSKLYTFEQISDTVVHLALTEDMSCILELE